MKKRASILVGTVSISLLVLGCDPSFFQDLFDEEYAETQAELDRNWKAWHEARIDHYTYEYFIVSLNPELAQKRRIEALSGKVVAAYAFDRQVYEPASKLPSYYTVDGQFGYIHKMISMRARKLRVKYDDAYHYPSEIYVDSTSLIVDAESITVCSNLVALQ